MGWTDNPRVKEAASPPASLQDGAGERRRWNAGVREIPVFGIVLFIVLGASWAAIGFTRGVEHLSSDQHLNLVLVLKGLDPSLFANDLIFEDADIANQYIPLYIGYLRSIYRLTGDLAGGYKLLVFPLNLLYLFGAYFVFLRCCRIRWAAVALAVLASFPLAVPLAGELFGIGPVQVITARMLFTGLFPILFLFFCLWIDRPVRLVLLFLAFGLLANLHPVSGLFVAPILALTYVLERKGGWQALGASVLMGMATLAGATPILWSQAHRVMAQTAGSAEAGDPLVSQLVEDRMTYLLYPPHTMAFVPPILVDLMTLAVAVGSVAVITRAMRSDNPGNWLALRAVAVAALFYLLFPDAKLLSLLVLAGCLLPQRRDSVSRESRLAAYFSISIFWVSIGGVILVQVVFGLLGRPVLFADMIRASRFAGFAVFLLLAVSVCAADWSRTTGLSRVACVLLVLATGFWEVRHTIRTYLRTRGDAAAADLAAVARWARDETSAGEVFLFDSPGFRVLARRSVAFATKDGLAVLYHRPDRAAAWLERQETLRAAGGDPEALWEAGLRYGVQYVVVPAGAMKAGALEPHVRYRNNTYAVVATDRVRPAEMTVVGTMGAK